MAAKSHIIFDGLLTEKRNDGAITLSQTQYTGELKKIQPADFAMNNQIEDDGKLRTALRQVLGPLIWLHQTCPDFGYDITRIATEAVAACTDPTLALQFIALYNRAVRFAQTYAREIAYSPPPGTLSATSARLRRLENRRLIIFTDAGFGPLAGSQSVEGSVTILGQVLSRDGSIECRGYLIDRRCAEIQRVCKSSMADEAHAAVTAAGQALWFQVLLTEIATCHYNIESIAPPTSYPMPDPFGPSPTDAEVNSQCASPPNTAAIPQVTCRSCKTNMHRSKLISAAQAAQKNGKTGHIKPCLFRPLLLTDCCSLYSAILRIKPKSLGKCAKLIMNQLRDLQSLIDMSFVGATCNLGDIETKHAAPLNIHARFFAACLFLISFSGRKAREKMGAAAD